MTRSPVLAAALAGTRAPFDAPWQARALAMAVLLAERTGCSWDDFRQHLIAAIADDPDRPYWDSWAVALERFATEVLAGWSG